MSNPRITAKERGLIKGALRRVFSRSDLRRKVMATALIEHTDANRPRVRKWGRCSECKKPTPFYTMEADHKNPIVPVNSSLEQMDWNTLVDRLWCLEEDLTPLCKPCHSFKTKAEAKERREYKRKRSKK